MEMKDKLRAKVVEWRIESEAYTDTANNLYNLGLSHAGNSADARSSVFEQLADELEAILNETDNS